MDLFLTESWFARKSFVRHCEHSEAIQKHWIATPLVAARDDGMDAMPMGLVSPFALGGGVRPIFPPRVSGARIAGQIIRDPLTI